MTDKMDAVLGKDPRRKGSFTLADVSDASRFDTGTQMWSRDGKTWYSGTPPEPPSDCVSATIVSVDAENGVITLSSKEVV